MENKLLIDILEILPEKADCYIQSPDLENEIIQNIMEESEYSYYKRIILTKENKIILINQELLFCVSEWFQKIEIKQESRLLFEGYDGVEFGILSKNIIVPKWFKEKYIPEECIISHEW